MGYGGDAADESVASREVAAIRNAARRDFCWAVSVASREVAAIRNAQLLLTSWLLSVASREVAAIRNLTPKLLSR